MGQSANLLLITHAVFLKMILLSIEIKIINVTGLYILHILEALISR